MAAPCGEILSKKIAKLSIWNNRQLHPPPTATYSYMGKESEQVCASRYQRQLSKIIMAYRQIQKHLKSEQFTLARLLFKIRNQQKRWKWYQLITKIDKILLRIQAVNISKCVEDIKECRYENRSSGAVTLHMPSRQMVQHLLVKLISISKLCGYTTALCEKTAVFLVQFLSLGHMVSNNLVFCSLISRIWVLLQALQSNVIKWYGSLYPWCNELKATPTPWLPPDEHLPESLSAWLSSENNLQNNQAKKSKSQKLLSKWFSEQEVHTTEQWASVDDSIKSKASPSLDLGEPVFVGEMLTALGISQKGNLVSQRRGHKIVKKTNVEVTENPIIITEQISQSKHTKDGSSLTQTLTSDTNVDVQTKKKRKKKKHKKEPNESAPDKSSTFTDVLSGQVADHSNATAKRELDFVEKESESKLEDSDSDERLNPKKKRKQSESVQEDKLIEVLNKTSQSTAEASLAGQIRIQKHTADGKRAEDNDSLIQRATVEIKRKKRGKKHKKGPDANAPDESNSITNMQSSQFVDCTEPTETEHEDLHKMGIAVERRCKSKMVDTDSVDLTSTMKRKRKHSESVHEDNHGLIHKGTLCHTTEASTAELVKKRKKSTKSEQKRNVLCPSPYLQRKHSDHVDLDSKLHRENLTESEVIVADAKSVTIKNKSKSKKKGRNVSSSQERSPSKVEGELSEFNSKDKGLSTSTVNLTEIVKSECSGMEHNMSDEVAENNNTYVQGGEMEKNVSGISKKRKKKRKHKKLLKGNSNEDGQNVKVSSGDEAMKQLGASQIETSVQSWFQSTQVNKGADRNSSSSEKRKKKQGKLQSGEVKIIAKEQNNESEANVGTSGIPKLLKHEDVGTSIMQVDDKAVMIPKKKKKKRKRKPEEESTELSVSNSKIEVVKNKSYFKSGSERSSLVCDLGQIKHHSKTKKVAKTNDTEIDDIFSSLE